MKTPTMAELDEWTDTLRKEFSGFEINWKRYEEEIDEIIKLGDKIRNELYALDGNKGKAASIGWLRLKRTDMWGIWQKLVDHLETFTLEREKQTARIITALDGVQQLKDEISTEHTKLREEQEQMRKEQAILREYFDTLRSQNEALLATRTAPSTSDNSTLNEIKDLIKTLKDD